MFKYLLGSLFTACCILYTPIFAELVEITYPEIEEQICTTGGLLDPDRIFSVMIDGTTDMSYCSLATRANLSLYTDYPLLQNDFFDGYIAQGDAIRLIEDGISKEHLVRISDTDQLKQLLRELQGSSLQRGFVDIYFHTPHTNSIFGKLSEKEYLLQGHRAIVFLGDDDEIYLLDTIGGTRSSLPQHIDTYKAYYEKSSRYIYPYMYFPRSEICLGSRYNSYQYDDTGLLYRNVNNLTRLFFDIVSVGEKNQISPKKPLAKKSFLKQILFPEDMSFRLDDTMILKFSSGTILLALNPRNNLVSLWGITPPTLPAFLDDYQRGGSVEVRLKKDLYRTWTQLYGDRRADQTVIDDRVHIQISR